MRMLSTLFILTIAMIFFIGCATSNFTSGQDFSSENIDLIVRGETTAEEIVSLFGEPHYITLMSATEEYWYYSYMTGTSSAQSFLIVTSSQSEVQQKNLSIVLANGVVSNFTFSDTTTPSEIKVISP